MGDHRGITLIEGIIVMAIAAILAGAIYTNYHLLGLANTTRCIEKIDSSLSKLRIETMSKWSSRHYIILEWKDTEKEYYLNYVTSTVPLDEDNWKSDATSIRSKVIGDRRITIAMAKQADGSDAIIMDSSCPYGILEFVPESGAFLSEWKQIIISSGGDSSVIHMVTKTGKHYLTN